MTSTVDRCLLAVSGTFFASVAALLLARPQYFYATIPGVAASGPMNVHLLRDVGIAYAVLALGFGFSLADRSIAPFVTTGAALYLVGHAALHVVIELSAGPGVVWAEAPGVYLPAIVACCIALVSNTRRSTLSRRP